jgi:Trk-type K+ transport system membrane component
MAETLLYYQVNSFINYLVIALILIYGIQFICMTFMLLIINIRSKIRKYCRSSKKKYCRSSKKKYDGNSRRPRI